MKLIFNESGAVIGCDFTDNEVEMLKNLASLGTPSSKDLANEIIKGKTEEYLKTQEEYSSRYNRFQEEVTERMKVRPMLV